MCTFTFDPVCDAAGTAVTTGNIDMTPLFEDDDGDFDFLNGFSFDGTRTLSPGSSPLRSGYYQYLWNFENGENDVGQIINVHVTEGAPTFSATYTDLTTVAGRYFEWSPSEGDAQHTNTSHSIDYDIAVTTLNGDAWDTFSNSWTHQHNATLNGVPDDVSG